MSTTHNMILNIVAQLDTQAADDPRFSDQLDDIADILTEDEENTIKILESLDEKQLAWITPVFEEISFVFQSQIFVDCITELGKKHANIENIENDILAARTVIED